MTQVSIQLRLSIYIVIHFKVLFVIGIGKALLRCSLDQTNSFKVELMMGLFGGTVSQHIASSVGFKVVIKVPYWEWKEEGQRVFDNPGPGNMSADLMVLIMKKPEDSTG